MANLSNINNKFLVTTTGEVLIGQTANNGNRLQITGADGASYIYLKTDVATTGGRIGFNGDALRVFNQQASGELQLGTAGTSRVRISNSLVVFPTITELRGDISTKFAIGNMGGASSQMMVSSRGFLTFNVSNTGSALDATERMRIDSSGTITTNTTAELMLSLNTTAANGGYLRFRESDTTKFFIGARGAVSGGTGTGYDIYTAAGNDLRLWTAGSTALTIDTSQNVGIGTTAPDYNLEVYGTDAKIFAHYTGNSRGGIAAFSGQRIAMTTTSLNDDLVFGYNSVETSASASFVEHMRIDNGTGNVGIGTTDPSAGKITVTESGSAYTGDFIYGGTNGSYGALRCTLSASNAPSFIDFFRSSYSTTQPVGAIVTSGSNCLYQSYSDYRLKENVQDLTGALDRLDNLQPKTFNYKNAPEISNEGFIAHELQEIVPQAVSGEKDGINEDGTPKYQGVDNAHIVPLLVGAIKELKAEIELLKTQINN